jgi:hypothetical protein
MTKEQSNTAERDRLAKEYGTHKKMSGEHVNHAEIEAYTAGWDARDEEVRELRQFVDWLEAGMSGMFNSWEDMQTQIEDRLLALKGTR